MNRLDHDREADLGGELCRVLRIGEHAVAARHDWDVELLRGLHGVRFVAHPLHAGDRRADEVELVETDEIGEGRALGQKADSRVDRIDTFGLGDADDRVGVEVALVRRAATEADQGVALAQR